MEANFITDNMIEWVKDQGAMIAGAGAAVLIGLFGSQPIKEYVKKRKLERYERKAREVQRKMFNVSDIYEKKNHILEQTAFGQSLIFKMTNGGGDVGPGAEMKITCLHESYRPPFDSIKEIYQGTPAKLEQIVAIAHLEESGVELITTSALPESDSKQMLIEKGVKCFVMFPITIRIIPRPGKAPDKEEIHYGVLNSKYGPDEEIEGLPKISSQESMALVDGFVSGIKDLYD